MKVFVVAAMDHENTAGWNLSVIGAYKDKAKAEREMKRFNRSHGNNADGTGDGDNCFADVFEEEVR